MHGKKDRENNLHVNAIIFDWSGTTVDYGCIAPAITFKKIFNKYGIEISMKNIRKFMGLPKMVHLKKLLELNDVSEQWQKKYGSKPDLATLERLYNDFTPELLTVLSKYSKPVNGLVNLVNNLKYSGIKIGSTTGYTKEMMKIVLSEAQKYSYIPDCVVTPEEAGGGRPLPWMCYLNLIKLKVYPTQTVIKVGDTISDIKEGLNAGMWSVGVIKGSNELGLNQEEINNYDKKKLATMVKEVRKRFILNGAHFVIEEISELEEIIPIINKKIYK